MGEPLRFEDLRREDPGRMGGWRPIYRRIEGRLFAILAVGPEAGIDKAGYDRAVRAARQRLDRLGKDATK